jgi:hypothetical protein
MDEAAWLACNDPLRMVDFLEAAEKKRQDEDEETPWGRWLSGWFGRRKRRAPTPGPAPRAGERPLRLFAVACCRRIWHLIEDAGGVVEIAERYADSLVGLSELRDAYTTGREEQDRFDLNQPGYRDWAPFVTATGAAVSTAELSAACAARYAADGAGQAISYTLPWPDGGDPQEPARIAMLAARAAEHTAQCVLLRDIFGNPFRPISLAPSSRTPTVLALAQAAYDNRRLPSGDLDTVRLAALADALEDAGCPGADILGHLRGPGAHVRGCWALDLVLGKE